MRKGEKTGTARNLRQRQTEAEKALWRLLRNRAMGGIKFRRQCPIGPYVVDFVSFDAKLIIELDGGQHAVNKAADDARTAQLQARGFRVLRIWNNDMLSNKEGVVLLIDQALNSPHPETVSRFQPLPQAGEGAQRRGDAAPRLVGEERGKSV